MADGIMVVKRIASLEQVFIALYTTSYSRRNNEDAENLNFCN